MIQALQITPEILTSNTDNINFDTIDLRTNSANCCGWLQYMNGGSDFTIIGGGTFELSFNATAPAYSFCPYPLQIGTLHFLEKYTFSINSNSSLDILLPAPKSAPKCDKSSKLSIACIITR